MKRQVALLIETSSQYGRSLLTGVIRYMRMHDQWLVFAEQGDLNSPALQWLESWKGDGIISRTSTPELRAEAKRIGIPLVDLTDRYTDCHQPCVRSDDAAIAVMAAEHLRSRHFSRFAFCGYQNEAWSHRRQLAFIDAVEPHTDQPIEIYNSPWQTGDALSYQRERNAVIEWLSSMTHPIGIMASNDVRGRHVVDACLQIGLTIPQDVAVIGVDNDELLCKLCSPPLSSIIPDAPTIGFRGAQILGDMMSGRDWLQRTCTIEPIGVATRQSSDVIAIEDASLASALHLIRQHACQGISVDDVAKQSNVSRSTLERQFRKLLGRTPQEEIRYVQIQRAKELLSTTDLSIKQIADCCGFEHPEYLHAVFKKFTAVTPGNFRRDAAQQKHHDQVPKAH